MFLRAVHLKRPDLKGEVEALVQQVWAQEGGAPISLGLLVPLMGLKVAPEFQEQLNARGNIALGEEAFHNEGPEIRRPVVIRGLEANFYMPGRLEGELGRFSHSFQLHFRPEYSIQITRFPFQMELRYLDISSERIFVGVRGGQNLHISLD